MPNVTNDFMLTEILIRKILRPKAVKREREQLSLMGDLRTGTIDPKYVFKSEFFDFLGIRLISPKGERELFLGFNVLRRERQCGIT